MIELAQRIRNIPPKPDEGFDRASTATRLFRVAITPLNNSEAEEIILDYEDPAYSGPYGDLSTHLWKEYIRQARELPDDGYEDLARSPSIGNGFNVLCRILSYAPAAYLIYCDENNADININELVTILIESGIDILKLFANRDINSNKTIETAFGLRKPKPTYDSVPFVIELSEEDELRFIPAKGSLKGANQEIADWDRIENPKAKCPAYIKTLFLLWEKAITICGEEPQLFASSLRLNNSSSELS